MVLCVVVLRYYQRRTDTQFTGTFRDRQFLTKWRDLPQL